jgi:hypothetical protein
MKIALKALSLTISGIGMVGHAQAACPIPNALTDFRGGAIDVSGTYEASSSAMRAVLGGPINCKMNIRASGQQTHTKSQLVSPLRDDLTSMAFQVGFATSSLQDTRPAELIGNLSFAMLDIERLGSQGHPTISCTCEMIPAAQVRSMCLKRSWMDLETSFRRIGSLGLPSVSIRISTPEAQITRLWI